MCVLRRTGTCTLFEGAENRVFGPRDRQRLDFCLMTGLRRPETGPNRPMRLVSLPAKGGGEEGVWKTPSPRTPEDRRPPKASYLQVVPEVRATVPATKLLSAGRGSTDALEETLPGSVKPASPPANLPM